MIAILLEEAKADESVIFVVNSVIFVVKDDDPQEPSNMTAAHNAANVRIVIFNF